MVFDMLGSRYALPQGNWLIKCMREKKISGVGSMGMREYLFMRVCGGLY